MGGELWQDEGGSYLFHYTEAHLARQIVEDECFFVGPGANFGPGLYATDLGPVDASPEEIRQVCFGGDAADNAFDAVLVLLADDPITPFVEVDLRAFCIPAEEGFGQLIALDSILVGVGRRQPGGGWRIEAWP